MHNNCQQLEETLTQQPLIFTFCPTLGQNEVVDIVRHSSTCPNTSNTTKYTYWHVIQSGELAEIEIEDGMSKLFYIECS